MMGWMDWVDGGIVDMIGLGLGIGIGIGIGEIVYIA